MQFLEALKYSKLKMAGSARQVMVLANYEMDQLKTYVEAYAKQADLHWKAEQCGYGNLMTALMAGQTKADYQIIFLFLEDFFPALSYRTQAQWTHVLLEDLHAESETAVKKFCKTIQNYLKKCPIKTVIVPPILNAPPLWPNAPVLMNDIQNLLPYVQAQLWAHFKSDDLVEILDLNQSLSALSPDQVRDSKALFHKGFPMSIEAIDCIAADCIRSLSGAFQAAAKKLLVTDLDQVLWRGVIGEDGIDQISAHPDRENHCHHVFQKFLKLLVSEGTLLAAASKNNAEDVSALLDQPSQLKKAGMILARNDFAEISCQWTEKSKQIQAICRRLNILPQDVVFVDDNPMELWEVSHHLPEVSCVAFPKSSSQLDTFLKELRSYFIKSKLTEEDKKRSRFYEQKKKAEAFKLEHANLDDYLGSLQMTASIEQVTDSNQERPFQLYNKTNQFNLTGERLSQAEWRQFLEAPNRYIFTADLNDQFGDHGIVAVALVYLKEQTVILHNLVLSCRVFNRTVETAFLEWIAAQFKEEAVTVKGRLRHTAKNEPCRAFFSQHCFVEKKEDANTKWFEAALPLKLPKHFIGVQSESLLKK